MSFISLRPNQSEILANKPNIVIKGRKEKFMMIDMTTPSKKKISLKVTEKYYKYLEIEINKMWDIRTGSISVVLGT